MGNAFVLFVARVAHEAQDLREAGCSLRVLIERPEDLGRADKGTPASVWQLAWTQALKSSGWRSAALRQCSFGTEFAKPTRLLGTYSPLAMPSSPGWPTFTADGF